MADYNIYIHAIGTGTDSSQSPTTPWSQKQDGGASQTTSQTSGGNYGGQSVINGIIKATGYASNPDSLVSKAITSFAKAFPIVAAAYAVVQLGDAIVSNAIEFAEIESGDYRFGVQYKNLKTSFNIAFHPISSTIQNFKTQNQWNRENQRLRMERDLLGDSVINSYTNRGV